MRRAGLRSHKLCAARPIFGLGEMANPLVVHSGYDADERVLALMMRGIGTEATAPIINRDALEQSADRA